MAGDGVGRGAAPEVSERAKSAGIDPEERPELERTTDDRTGHRTDGRTDAARDISSRPSDGASNPTYFRERRAASQDRRTQKAVWHAL